MNFDPDVQKFLAAMQAANLPQLYQLDVPTARAVYQQLGEKFGGPVIEVAAVEEREAGGAVGKLPIRIYRPHGLAQGAAPALIYFHGGGWTIGSIQTHDKVCRRIADQAKCVVISIEYRLAPEYPMPAGAEDAIAALLWIAGHADELNVDALRLAVGGDSAGGGLAAVAAIAARDSNLKLRCQILIYPCTDSRESAVQYPSRKENDQVPPLNHDNMKWFLAQYRPDPAAAEDWRVSPLVTPELSGLAPTLLLTGERDILHDEGMLYGNRLEAAGIEVMRRNFPGMIHGFIKMAGVLHATLDAFGTIALFLEQRLLTPR